MVRSGCNGRANDLLFAQACIGLAKERGQKLKEILTDSVEAMEVDQAE